MTWLELSCFSFKKVPISLIIMQRVFTVRKTRIFDDIEILYYKSGLYKERERKKEREIERNIYVAYKSLS